jgi:ABC transporter DrrB family efflux protein
MKILLSIIKKEYQEFIRDKGIVIAMVLMPAILMLTFGNAFQGDIKNLKTVLINEDQSEYSQKIVDAIEKSENFSVIDFSGNVSEAKELLKKNKARVIFYIPLGFEYHIKNASKGNLWVYIDSSDYLVYNVINGASSLVLKDSFKDIIDLIVYDMEAEKEEKSTRLENIRELVDSISEDTSNTLDGIDNLQKEFDSMRSLVKDTENQIADTKNKILQADLDISSIKSNMSDIENIINSLDDNIGDVNSEIKELASNPLIAEQIDQLYEKFKDTKDDFEDVQSEFDEIQNQVDTLSIPSSDSVSNEKYNISQFYNKINVNEDEVNSLNNTAQDIEQSYLDIQKRVNDVSLDFELLRRDFISSPLELNSKYVYGEITYFQYLIPSLISMSLFFIGVVLTILDIVEERSSGTIYRLNTTPIKKMEILGGKFLIFFFAGLVEVVYFLFLAIIVFQVDIAGSLIDSFTILFLLMSSSIGLGLLISSVVKSTSQAVMIIPLLIIPSILISNVFSPVELMPSYMKVIAQITPLYHANTALREIMIKGAALSEVSLYVYILIAYSLITLLLGVLVFKKKMN